MGRPTKKPEDAPVEESMGTEAPDKSPAKDKEAISPKVDALMRLYPQYEELWITPKGFVHPVGVPQYLLKGATLYKNKYFKK